TTSPKTTYRPSRGRHATATSAVETSNRIAGTNSKSSASQANTGTAMTATVASSAMRHRCVVTCHPVDSSGATTALTTLASLWPRKILATRLHEPSGKEEVERRHRYREATDRQVFAAAEAGRHQPQ